MTRGMMGKYRIVVYAIFITALLSSVYGDELIEVSLPSDTTAVDSLLADSLRDEAALDTIVTYSADMVMSTVNPRVTTLSGNAKIKYRSMEMTAAKIDVWWDKHIVKAEGRLDTVRAKIPKYKIDSLAVQDSTLNDSLVVLIEDSTYLDIDSTELFDEYTIEWVGLPQMKDGAQTVTGHQMTYDLNSRQGKVMKGKTSMEDGNYTGEIIKKIDKNTYYIRSGDYSTCNDDDPHYTFWSKDSKLLIKDKVVARPVVLKFGPVPVAILPFAIFPTRGGRHSGLIIPTYGESSGQGRYFRNLGYFWAANDYFDVTTKLNFYERTGLQLYNTTRYLKRYVLNGSISGSWINESGKKRWDINAYHNQTLSPSSRIVMTAQYASNESYYRDYSQNINQRLNQDMRSSLTLSKNWPETPYSGSVNLGYTENLVTGQVNQTLPAFRFSRSSSAILPPAEGTKAEDIKWWNEIFFSYGADAQNVKNVNSASVIDYNETTEETTTRYNLTSRLQRGMSHSVNVSARPKSLEYFSISPGVSYKETWYDEWYDFYQNDDGTIDTVEQDGFKSRRIYNGSVSFNTKLYGIFKPHLFSLEAIRHTLSPKLSFSYTPDFSEDRWGYYKIYDVPTSDTTSVKKYFDRFSRTTLYGGTSKDERMAMSISLNNLFEYKLIQEDDQEKKGELFSFNTGTAINFVADSLKWSNLNSTMRIRPFGGDFGGVTGLSLSLSSGHSFYDLITDSEGKKVVVSDPAPNGLRLLTFSLTSSFSISGEAGVGTSSSSEERDTTNFDRQPKDRFDNQQWDPSPLPWDARVNFRHYENHSDPDNVSIIKTAGMNLDLTITDNWKASYDLSYNLKDWKMTSSGISLYRDLHCWEGRLTWNPTGISKGYYLIISIKASQLKDVKVEKRQGGGGYLSY